MKEKNIPFSVKKRKTSASHLEDAVDTKAQESPLEGGKENLRELHCPRCGRFLAMEGVMRGYLTIKCQACKTVVEVKKKGPMSSSLVFHSS